MSCVALVTKNGSLSKQSIPIPTPAAKQLLVKVSHVAQNPTDIQSFDGNVFGDDAVLGCDFVGTVEKVGSDVTRVKPGTTIAGLIWGGEVPRLGGYSEYTLADERICFPLPENVSPEEGATVPLAACTALLALFSRDCLNIRKQSGDTVLIWGGSSSVGLYAVQIARYYGLSPIATCSKRHHEQLKALGAEHVFDYRDKDVVSKIRDATRSNLEYVFDTIGNETSSYLGSETLRERGGGLCTVRPTKEFTEKVKSGTNVSAVLVWTAFLKDHSYGELKWPASKDDHELAAAFFDELPKLLSDGTIKTNTPKVYGGGLDDVEKGFQEYRDGAISNYKIVYKL